MLIRKIYYLFILTVIQILENAELNVLFLKNEHAYIH
jgi:hypothetical protein